MTKFVIEIRLLLAEWLLSKAESLAPKGKEGNKIRIMIYGYFNDLIL